MKNVHVSFEEELLANVDRFAASSPLSRSAVVRDALRSWIPRKQVEAFEDEWIAKLKENLQDKEEDEAWLEVESWSDP